MVASIAHNGGRSCVNASSIWVPSHAEEISEAVAARLSEILPLAAHDENALLAPFVDPNVAERISKMIDQGLGEQGAREVTARHRQGDRLTKWQNCSYLLPTLVLCEDADHSLANKEFLFPFASVVKANQERYLRRLGQVW